MLLTLADFSFFNDCTAASTSLWRMGWSSSVCVWGQFSTDRSPLALLLYSSEQYSVHRFSICRSSVRQFPEWSWIAVAFPCFTVVKSFTSWYALLLLFFLRFSAISLHCSPIFFCLFHTPLDIVVHYLVFLRSSRFKYFLPVLSFCHTDKEFLWWPRVLSSDNVCQRPNWLFQSLLCWRWRSLNPGLYLYCS